jgi:hypothetical protein
MKPIKKIIALSITTIAIVMFWLAPNINKATDQRYTRRYEDTERTNAHDSIKSKKTAAVSATKSEKETKKVYKKESINPNGNLSKLKVSMFSRSMQFEPEIALDSMQEMIEIVDTTTLAL